VADEHSGLFQDLLRRIVGPKPLAGPYHAFTTAFDREVDAANLGEVLGALEGEDSALLDQAWREMQLGLLPWRTRLLVLAGDASARIREATSREARAATVITLLMDQSGSMRGQKMLYAAATADLCQEFLSALGVRIEVLGFTTSKWRGGRSRAEWIRRRRPHDPGRLNDLLHVVYRDAEDTRASTGGYAFRQMLRPDLPKENVDGEAIAWAVSRLRRRSEARKVLVVVSDGAPVDDSTLHENAPDYLADHLKRTIEEVSAAGDVELTALGVGYDVRPFFTGAGVVDDAVHLGEEMLRRLEKILLSPVEPGREDSGT
jgi:cobaltochelatase CobT